MDRAAHIRPGMPVSGIVWAAVAAALSACFVLPWKLANQAGAASPAVFVLLGTAAIWGTASLPLAARFASRAHAVDRSAEGWLAAQLAGLTLFGNWASANAVGRLSAPLFAVILRTEVLLVALLAWLLLRERVERNFWLGVGLAGVGLWVSQAASGALQSTSTGVLFAVGAATSFGSMTVLTRRVIHRIDPLRVNTLRLWGAVALWIPFNLGAISLRDFALQLIGYASLAALCGPVAARLCLMYSTRHVEARVTATIGLAAPVLTLGAAWLVLGEWPGPRELGGGALMLCGIAIPLLGWLRRATPAPAPIADPVR